MRVLGTITDGVETGRLTKAPMSDRPQHLILSCEVEKWRGKIEEAILPDAFTIDYVRVWQTPAQIEADAKRPEILSPGRAKYLLERMGYFNWLDKNKDRQLAPEEFLSDRKDKIDGEKEFGKFDRNKDKLLSLEEFLFSGNKPIPNLEQAIADVLAEDKPRREAAFKTLDRDQDGSVTKEDYLAPEKEQQREKAGQLFDKYDKDKNGSLGLEEFIREGR
ncbi:EF-hand domain-containing protein [Luteolibacter ambystomatis]|uniref:EF-hand domain-containing protein n=1 Tax=Luteolibacter ambystomatis TaxID=2824561 RepID=A0A975G799_9BACT|nr:EF-hand domain-containing protein [Luteolibacter ambystomatis]QUE50108.1 EF-hand domain-containing protein [Luteolibacter ambystomatis]